MKIPSTHTLRSILPTGLFWSCFYIFLTNSLWAQTVVTGENFGYTPGQFAVSDGGAATYSIPFVLPPGTAGLQPKIGLNYSSQGGNGTVGLGWTVTGLSSISRSSRTRAQDENADANQQSKSVPTGITFDKNDRFSLDGERLVLAPQSISITQPFDNNYGNDQTVYFTEQHSYTKTTYYESSATQSYFKSYTKSGLIFEYGNTADSRVLSTFPTNNSTVVTQWLVSKIQDRKGNYMTFTYTKNDQNGEVYPERIDYTGNSAAGVIPYNSVRFIYEDRPDLVSVYGIRNKQKNTYTKRLKSVQVYFGTTFIREYKLSYQTASESGYSLLTQIAECDGAGQRCFEPTTFAWSNEKVEQDNLPAEITTTGIGNDRLFGDFNGDGLTDIASYSLSGTNLTVQFHTNNGGRSFVPRISRTVNIVGGGSNFTLRTGELNGDQLTDIIATWQPTTSGSNSSAFFISSPSPDTLYNCNYYTRLARVGNSDYNDELVDLNEDGITDWVDIAYSGGTSGTPTLTAARIALTLPSSNSTAPAQTFYQSQSLVAGYNNSLSFTTPEELFEDLNNDGLTDLLLYDKASGQNLIIWTEAIRTTADASNRKNQFQARQLRYDRSTSIPPSALIGATNTVFLKDFNADGLPDLSVYKPTDRILTIYANRGGYPDAQTGVAYLFGQPMSSGQITTLNLTSSLPASYTGVYPNDLNADGFLDITLYEASTGNNYTYLNSGNFSFNSSAGLYNAWPQALFKTGNLAQVGTFLKGSHADLYYKDVATNRYYLQRLRQNQGWSIKQITNGAKLSVIVRYDNLLNSALYERAGQVTFPNVDVQTPLYVVAKVKTRTSLGDETAKTYHYSGATINVEGRGFRGFTKTIERDTISGIYDVNYYRQGADNYKLTGQTLTRSERYYSNDILISRTENVTAVVGYPTNNPTSFHAYSPQTITRDEVNNKTQIVRQQHDDWGNPTYVVVDYGSGLRDSTVNTYTNNETDWILGRLTGATLYRFAPNQPTITRQSSFTYDAPTGLLTRELADANLSSQQQVIKEYEYDLAGNIIRSRTIAHNGTAFETRETTSEYDVATKRFVTKTTNPLGHTATTTYSVAFGLPVLTTDPNGLTALNEYDSFSRPIKQTGPDGSWKTMAYWKASTANYNSPPEAVFLTYTKTSANQETIEQYDSYNRAVQTKSRGFDGRWVLSDHEFSRVVSPENREKIRDWFPYYEGDTRVGYTEKQLDALGRVISMLETKTGGTREAKSRFGGLVTEYLNVNNQKKTEVDDAKDRLVQSSWQDGHSVYYTYDAADRQLTVRDLKGNTITNVYDQRGYKTSMTDPDMGTYQYLYNGFGELVRQTYPDAAVVVITYDKLGRLLTRTEPEGVTTYTYDQGNKGIGRVNSVSSYSTSQTFTYDNLGRKGQETLTINGQTYTTIYTYDNESRLLTLKYPALSVTLKHVYNSRGFLSELRNNANNNLLWQVVTIDAKGDIVEQAFGNGVRTTKQYEAATQYLQRIRSVNSGGTSLQEFSYEFNDLGHLTSRTDVKRNKRETFGYDGVSRLISTQIEGGAGTTLTYDELGNILTKSDVGSYEYGSMNNGPHRLLNVRTNNSNVTCSFTLDVVTEFTSFNKVRRIANDTSYAQVIYGADQQRVMQRLYVRNQLNRTKIYVGGLVEIETFAGGRSRVTGFVGGIGLWLEETTGGNTTTQIKYYLKDHLGSVTGFTGSGGTLLEEFSFDAWGARRNADWSPLESAITGSHERGFTNHEHYDLFSLIDMNGRVYDPILGRFLSPDPIIQDITDLQMLNRYSYVGNNPLSYTDPSGYFFKKIKKFIKKYWKTVAVVAVAVVTGAAALTYFGSLLTASGSALFTGTQVAILSGAASGFASNVTGTLLNGGSLGSALQSGFRGAVIGGITAGLTYSIGDLAGLPLKEYRDGLISSQQAVANHLGIKIVGHGFVQGAMAEIQGEGFLNGFLSGAISGAIPESAGVVTQAIAGGTASELTGGNFASGAISAAFVQMYNDEMHPDEIDDLIRNECKFCGVPIVGGIFESGVRAGIAISYGNYWQAAGYVGKELAMAVGPGVVLKGGRMVANLLRSSRIGVSQGSSAVLNAERSVMDWLGKMQKPITNQSGNKVFMSVDGTRKIRFDIANPHGYPPHIQLEVLKNGKWVDAIEGLHHIYPK